jgi:hypothetical protein
MIKITITVNHPIKMEAHRIMVQSTEKIMNFNSADGHKKYFCFLHHLFTLIDSGLCIKKSK